MSWEIREGRREVSLGWHLRRLWLDVRFGQCSGIPLCCITWFVTGWKLISVKGNDVFYSGGNLWATAEAGPRARLHALYLNRVGQQFSYIPCPACILSGSRVQVLRCTPECGHVEEARILSEERFGRLT